MRMFLVYVVVELAVIVAVASAIGFGWTVLLLLAAFVLGVALAGSQVRRHLHRLRSGPTAVSAQGLVTDSALVALGTVMVVIPGLASSALGLLLLLPPTRAALRPLATALAARGIGRMPLVTVVGTGTPPTGRGDYIEGEVIDVVDVEPTAVESKPE